MLLTVLSQGIDIPFRSKTVFIFLAPQPGFSMRMEIINSSTSVGVLFAMRNGFLLLSDKPSFKSFLSIHLYPVFLVIPNSRHRELKLLQAFAASTNSFLNSSTVLSSHGTKKHSFLVFFAAYYIIKLYTMSLHYLYTILLHYTCPHAADSPNFMCANDMTLPHPARCATFSPGAKATTGFSLRRSCHEVTDEVKSHDMMSFSARLSHRAA